MIDGGMRVMIILYSLFRFGHSYTFDIWTQLNLMFRCHWMIGPFMEVNGLVFRCALSICGYVRLLLFSLHMLESKGITDSKNKNKKKLQ